jgi:poly-gamma-glutamate synthase PgsB/CapB
MQSLLVPAVMTAAGLAGLGWEASRLSALRRRIPLRIAVTGTRGKSTVTRLVAAALRADGRTVVAKTTGSRPVLIFPDGTESEIFRPGSPTILEQKAVLRAAVRSGASALVAEMMSIGSEALGAEAGKILRPHILIVTNARLDHRREMGRTREVIAATLTRAFLPGTAVLVLEEEMLPVFAEAVARTGCRLIVVPAVAAAAEPLAAVAGAFDFPANIRLAAAAARLCGIEEGRIKAGLAAAKPDFGGLKVWRLRPPSVPCPACTVSLFAANEPESTALALRSLDKIRPGLPPRRVAILALRADRDDRTRQWLEAASRGAFDGYVGVAAVGDHARAVARRLRRIVRSGPSVRAPQGHDPASLTAAALDMAGGEACLVGMGNIVGAGARLVDYWSAAGEPL